MRTFYFILILLFHGVSLFASDGGASLSDEISDVISTEEVTAYWENDSNSQLLGDRVLSDVRNRNEQSVALNADCSFESIDRIVRLRKFATDIISASCTNSIEAFVAGRILEKTAAVSFTPLTFFEKKLLSESLESGLSTTGFSRRGFSSANMPQPEYTVSPLTFSFTTSSVNKLKIQKDKKRGINSPPSAIICVKKLFDMEFADLYRLFLYVRDNSGNGSSCYVTYSSVPLRFYQFQNNSTSSNKTSETVILQSGATS